MEGGSLFSRTGKKLEEIRREHVEHGERVPAEKAVDTARNSPRKYLAPSCFIFVSAHRARFEARNLYFKAIKRATRYVHAWASPLCSKLIAVRVSRQFRFLSALSVARYRGKIARTIHRFPPSSEPTRSKLTDEAF